ncbi:MAG: tetratricopeptide repeat protein [Candidatus Krumholzibacteria bacterium]
MKICPFISHMLGDDNASTLIIDESPPSSKSSDEENIVILGYEEGKEAPAATSTKAKKTSKKDIPSHLLCIKESCRFYKTKTGDCQFDLIFSMLDKPAKTSKTSQASSADLSKEVSGTLAKDIDKIWKFQTQSVSELIKSFAESEKSQSKVLEELKKDLEKKIDSMPKADGKSSGAEVARQIEALQEKIDSMSKPDNSAAHEEMMRKLDALQEKIDSSPKADGKSSDTEVARQIEVLQKKIDSMPKPDTSVNEEMARKLDALQKTIESMPKPDKNGSEEITLKLDALQRKIEKQEGSVEGFTTKVSEIVLDLRQNFNKLQAHTEDISRQLEHYSKHNSAPTANLKGQLESTLKAQEEMEKRVTSSQDAISSTVKDIQRQQKSWETRMDSIAEYQEEMLGYMEEGKKHRETEQVRHAKKDAKKFNNLGVTSFHNGAYEMARDQFLEAVKVDSEFAEAYNNLGLAYTELDDDSNASNAFKRAVELSPSLHAAYNNLGYIFFKRGHYDQAVEMYNEALGRSTDNTSAYTNLGNAYYKMGKIDEAQKAWSKALEIDPGNDKAKKNLQRISEEVS